jgi:hypothetical protein
MDGMRQPGAGAARGCRNRRPGRYYFRYLAWLLLVWSSSHCFSQVITVRIINDKNGHALPGQRISVSLFYGKGETAPEKYESKLSLETDANGVAQFALPQPAPAHLWVGAGLPSQYWFCSCNTRALEGTQELIEKGIVGRLDSKSSKVPDAKPGQIVFVARPYNLLERILYPLLKE